MSEIAGRSWPTARKAHLDDHLLIFGDVHYLMALAAAGRTGDAARMVESL